MACPHPLSSHMLTANVVPLDCIASDKSLNKVALWISYALPSQLRQQLRGWGPKGYCALGYSKNIGIGHTHLLKLALFTGLLVTLPTHQALPPSSSCAAVCVGSTLLPVLCHLQFQFLCQHQQQSQVKTLRKENQEVSTMPFIPACRPT